MTDTSPTSAHLALLRRVQRRIKYSPTPRVDSPSGKESRVLKISCHLEDEAQAVAAALRQFPNQFASGAVHVDVVRGLTPNAPTTVQVSEQEEARAGEISPVAEFASLLLNKGIEIAVPKRRHTSR